MLRNKKVLISLFTTLFLNGCTSTTEEIDIGITIDQQILEASQKIQLAQAELYYAGALNEETSKLPITLFDKLITVSWHGDASELLKKLAQDRKLKFNEQGVKLPLPVSLSVKNKSYDEVLQMLRAQIGYNADIVQTPKELVLHYNRPKPNK